jgi:hypothetical protein
MSGKKMHGGSSQLPWKIDGASGLPWFTTIHGEMAERALGQDLHVVDIHLAGLAGVLDTQGPAALASILREIVRGASGLLDDRDQLSRQTGDRLLLVTARQPEELATLMRTMVAQIFAAGVQVDGARVPRVNVGFARVLQASDYAEAVARLDVAILSAEFTAGPVFRADAGGEPAGMTESSGAREPAGAKKPHGLRSVSPREQRAVLSSLRLDLAGLVATAIVELSFGRRHTVARSVGRNAEERRLFLVGEATTRAVTELLPSGYGVVIHEVKVIQPGAPEQGRGILSSVLFLSPHSEQFLFGVASIGDDPRVAAARASLSAVNRKIEPLLAATAA